MSFAHLFLLLLHYHIILTCSRKKKGRDFVGLILTAWITSAALGCVNTSLELHLRRFVVVMTFVVISVFLVCFYFNLRKKCSKQKRIRLWYINNFLATDEFSEIQRNSAKKQWNPKILAAMLASFIICSLPWMVFNVTGFHEMEKRTEHSISLSVYLLTYYVPSGVCIYMKYSDFKISEVNIGLERNYRLRHYSRRSQENLLAI